MIIAHSILPQVTAPQQTSIRIENLIGNYASPNNSPLPCTTVTTSVQVKDSKAASPAASLRPIVSLFSSVTNQNSACHVPGRVTLLELLNPVDHHHEVAVSIPRSEVVQTSAILLHRASTTPKDATAEKVERNPHTTTTTTGATMELEQQPIYVSNHHDTASSSSNGLSPARSTLRDEQSVPRSLSSPLSASRQKQVQAQQQTTAIIAVYVKTIDPETMQRVPMEIDRDGNVQLWDLATKLEYLTSIPVSKQTLSVLISPAPQEFTMAKQTAENAVAIPSSAVVLLSHDNASGQPTTAGSNNSDDNNSEPGINTFPLRSGRQLKISSKTASSNASTQNSVLDEVRERLTEVLCDIRKHVSLDMIARMTTRSKSSLSLWRRGMYRGNNLLIAKAVTAALRELQQNSWKYDPVAHNGCIPFER